MSKGCNHYHKNSEASFNDSDIPCRISFKNKEFQAATITGIKINYLGEIAFIEVSIQEVVYKILWNINRPKRDDIAIMVNEELLAQ